ncbi:MAG: glycosyltransferase family 4 protein [Planctomycetes bacterium]|nr:glycosyltransferase family 4 protein [Planctomycetota bacterium]
MDDLLDCFETLRARERDVALLLVGDGPERERLEARVRDPELRGRVHFTGAVDRDTVAGLCRAADIAIAPYPELEHFYFSPLKLFEFMAMGLPVVSTRTGQIGDLIQHEESGLLAAPGRVDQLVASVERLLEDPRLRARLGDTAREWILERATWRHRVADILDRVRALP